MWVEWKKLMYNYKRYNNKLNVISNRLKIIREQKNVKVTDLSDKLMILGVDLTPSAIYDIEANNRAVRDYEVYAIATILKEPMESFYTDFVTELDL